MDGVPDDADDFFWSLRIQAARANRHRVTDRSRAGEKLLDKRLVDEHNGRGVLPVAVADVAPRDELRLASLGEIEALRVPREDPVEEVAALTKGEAEILQHGGLQMNAHWTASTAPGLGLPRASYAHQRSG